MELLIALIGEFVIAAAVTCFTLFLEFVVAVISILMDLLFWRSTKRRRAKNQGMPGLPSQRSVAAKVVHVSAILSGGFLVLGLIALVAINTFMFEPAVSWAAGKISQKTGIAIQIGEAQGNLFTGRLSIKDMLVERRNVEKTEYMLSAKRIEADVDVLSLVFGTATLSSLALEGVTGDIWTKPKSPKALSATGSRQQQKPPRKNFEITELMVSDASIGLNKPGFPRASLTINTMTSAPFRSQYAAFDVFFRSNVAAAINGHNIAIATSGDGDGRKTSWLLKDFPASSIRHFVDKPPFNWFEQGTLDVIVEDRWANLETPEIDMDWRLVLKDVKVVIPKDTGLVSKAVAAPIARYINTRDKDIDLRFRTVMNKEQFMNKTSLDATGIWNAVLDGTARAIADRSDAKASDVKSKIEESVDRIRNFLDKKRKKDPDNQASE